MWLLSQDSLSGIGRDTPLLIVVAIAIAWVVRETIPPLISAWKERRMILAGEREDAESGSDKRAERERMGWTETINRLGDELKELKGELKAEDERHEREKLAAYERHEKEKNRLEARIEVLRENQTKLLTDLAERSLTMKFLTEENKRLREKLRKYNDSEVVDHQKPKE